MSVSRYADYRVCWRGIDTFLMALIALVAIPVTAAELSDAVAQPAIVVIIDDVGDNWAQGSAALALPGPVTYAFLPHSPFAAKIGPARVRQWQRCDPACADGEHP